MKPIFLTICLLVAGLGVEAQYTWCVSVNGKTRLKHVAENKEKNKIWLTQTELNTAGAFKIKFDRYDRSMLRSILVYDSIGAGILNWDEVKRTWQIKTAELKKLLEEKGPLSFCYTEIPRDVNQAALIRVRPVHLCTINQSSK